MKTDYDPTDLLSCKNHEIEELREQNYALAKAVFALGVTLLVICVMYVH